MWKECEAWQMIQIKKLSFYKLQFLRDLEEIEKKQFLATLLELGACSNISSVSFSKIICLLTQIFWLNTTIYLYVVFMNMFADCDPKI